jgi:hypothetical protein
MNGSFLPSSLSLLPTPRSSPMPKSSLTSDKGKKILKEAQEQEAIAIAARTAVAVAKYEALSLELIDLTEESDTEEPREESSSSSAPSDSIYWTRQVSEGPDLQVFTRGQGESITIFKAPGGEGWVINYDEPDADWPS